MIDIAILIALGIDPKGYCHVLCLETAWGETSYSWDQFIGGLKRPGLKGIWLFTSDAHPWIHPAIKKHYPGAVQQRCQHHFSVNALDLFSKSQRDNLYKMQMHAWDADTYEEVKERLDQISSQYQDKYPELVEFISEHGWETLGVYDAALVQHYKRLRTTNIIKHVNQELK